MADDPNDYETMANSIFGFLGAFGIGLGITAAFVHTTQRPKIKSPQPAQTQPVVTPVPTETPVGVEGLRDSMHQWLKRAQLMTEKMGPGWLANPDIESTTQEFLTPELAHAWFGQARALAQGAGNTQPLLNLLAKLEMEYSKVGLLTLQEPPITCTPGKTCRYRTENGVVNVLVQPTNHWLLTLE